MRRGECAAAVEVRNCEVRLIELTKKAKKNSKFTRGAGWAGKIKLENAASSRLKNTLPT